LSERKAPGSRLCGNDELVAGFAFARERRS
jgi:hypothetical protein